MVVENGSRRKERRKGTREKVKTRTRNMDLVQDIVKLRVQYIS